MNNFLAFVLRTETDCTNGGLSSRVWRATTHFKSDRNYPVDATGYSEREAQNLAEKVNENDFIIVEDECYGRRLRAIPAGLIKSGRWTMFGGNFLTASDSRFFENPVKIHDRVE